MGLRRANRDDVIKYTTPDGEGFIEVRKELTKGEINTIMRHFPIPEKDDQGENIPNIGANLEFIERFIVVALVRWNVEDENGNVVLPSVETYLELDAESGNWIQQKMMEHMGTVMGKQVAEDEGKPSESENSTPVE